MAVVRKLIFGNWKMAQGLAKALAFVEQWQLSDNPTVEIAVFPSYPHLFPVLERVATLQKKIPIGAQDCSTELTGAFTGEVSAGMLAELGCSYVLIGHSERRQRGGETNETLKAKLQRAVEAKVTPVFCCGETEKERLEGRVFEVLDHQLKAIEGLQVPFVVAYEPVWAIGTGRVAKIEEIQEVHAYLRKHVSSAALGIQYGGSVKSSNASEILALPAVDGLLVGGASLQAEEFQKIVQAGNWSPKPTIV